MRSYHDNANLMLLERIPLSARSVLDVGCSTGALGLAFCRLNPTARLLGIEIDGAAAAIAAERLDEVAVVDVEADPWPFATTTTVDCITYGDVLEHLRDPWAVLRRHAETLSANGTILICVPNIEHWSFAARLLAGGWDYEDQGLFDRDHLRWFSNDSMRRGLTELGLAPCDVTPMIYEHEETTAAIKAIAPALALLNVDPADYAARASPLQYIWRVRRQPPSRLMVVSSMMEHVGGVSHVRIEQPIRALATDPTLIVQIADAATAAAIDPNSPKIYILHRPVLVGEHSVALVRRLLAAQCVIVTEMDDHPEYFPDLQRPDCLIFRGVHAVQTSTMPLLNIIQPQNPEVVVFPNAIHALRDVQNFETGRRMTLFYGGLNRQPDWQPLVPVLNAVAASVGDRLSFCIVHDQALYDQLETPYKTFTPTCDYDTYLDLLGRCEMSLMPLNDTPFNRAKSDLKFIEAASCRVAALASAVVYADTLVDGHTGLLFRSPDELHARLLRLVGTPLAARALGDEARAYVTTRRMLAFQVQERADWYRSLWRRRAALTQALLERTPELTTPARV